ncbi:protein-serine/threonine phosphatase, partial [Enterococcus sp. 2201sp1_2201st1_B8_2201SCRN_220225]
IQRENQVIYNKGQEQMQTTGMGTTIVASGIFDKNYIIAHVGDSRAYLLRQGRLNQLTEDHSLVNELVREGEITKEMAATHPRRNVLTRSVGMPGDVAVDVTDVAAFPEDILLIASDGLTNMITEAEIAEILANGHSLADRADELIRRANEQGGVDNITVLLCERGGHEQ